MSKGSRNAQSSCDLVWGNRHKPFAQLWVTDEPLFQEIHRCLVELHPRAIDLRHGVHERMHTPPCHRLNKVERHLQSIQQTPIPVPFQHPPAALNRVIFAMIRRIIGQLHGQARVIHELHQSLDKLGTPTVVLWTVIQVEHQGRDVRHAGLDLVPPLLQPIHEAIAGHLRGHAIHKQFVGGRQQNADRRHLGLGLKIVVHGLGRHATLAPTRKRAKIDRRFCIYRQTQGRRSRIRSGIDLI